MSHSHPGAYLGDHRKYLQVRRAKMRALWEDIKARHTEELASAKWMVRCRIWWRMVLEYRQECKRILPSAYAI